MTVPIKLQIDKLLAKEIECGNIHVWENWQNLWKIYRLANDSEKQAACLLYVKRVHGDKDEKVAVQIETAIKKFVVSGKYSPGYFPHLRRVLHNDEWEEVLEAETDGTQPVAKNGGDPSRCPDCGHTWRAHSGYPHPGTGKTCPV